MTSKKQIKSNRQNAQKSTGPRTREGKARSARNALKQGFFSCQSLLPDEDEDLFLVLLSGLRASLHPEGFMESLLVDKIACLSWRLRRFSPFEAEVLATRYVKRIEMNQIIYEDAELPTLGEAFTGGGENDAFSKLARYEAHLDRCWYKAFHELQALQAARRGKPENSPSERPPGPQGSKTGFVS